MANWFQSTFSALSERNFRTLWIGTVCAHLAFFMSTVVQSIVAYDLGGTNTSVGGVVAAQGIAMTLLGPLGGALADRWPKKLMLGVSQSIPAMAFLGLCYAFATETIRIETVAFGSFMIGVSFAFLGPARQALIVELVPESNRGNAVALTQIASTASQVGGPAIAGILLSVAFAGAAGAYGTMGVLYVISTLLLLLLPPSPMREGARDSKVLADVRAGIHYVFTRPRLRSLVLMYIAVIMLGFPYVTVMPAMVEREFGRGTQAYSFLAFLSSCGALSSSLLVARYADHARAALVFGCMGLLFGVALVGLSQAPSFEAACAVTFAVGAGFGGFMTLNGAVIVRATDPAFYGRVMSFTMLAFGAFGLMGLPIGLLADAVGERNTLLAQGLAVCATLGIFAVLLSRAPD